MAASKGYIGMTTTVEMDTGSDPSTPVWTIIGEPKDISGLGATAETADFTHMQSPAGYRENRQTFKNPSAITFACNFVDDDPGQMALMDKADTAPTPLTKFRITLPSSTVFIATAFPSYTLPIPMAGPVELNVSLAVTGPVVRS